MMNSWILFFIVLVLSGHAECQGELDDEGTQNYDNYTLVQITPINERQLQDAATFTKELEHYSILKASRAVNDSLDLLVPPIGFSGVMIWAYLNGLSFKVKRENYGRSFQAPREPKRRTSEYFDIFGYNSFTAMNDFIDVVAQKHPDLVQLQTLGNSFEGRKMRLVKISQNPNAGHPIIFIDAGIHAREWVAPAMALYIIKNLVSNKKALNDELNGVDWYILPLVNPDGYEYTRSSRSKRMWRKTRSKSEKTNCIGVDGNRNYGYKWAVSGVSRNPCDLETYAGPEPFSEPETRMVRNVMLENKNRIKLYVSLHAYGQYLVYPWGYTGDSLPNDWKRLDRLARRVSESVERAGGKPFNVLSAGKWYAAAGGSDDFAFGEVGVPYSYTMELTDGYEFQYPERYLKTVLPPFYEGFKTFAREIHSEFGNKNVKKREVLKKDS